MANDKIYNKTSLPEILSVKSIISIFRREISGFVPPDVHDFFELCYVESGVAKALLDDEIVTVNEGQFIIYAPNSVHSSAKDANGYWSPVTLNNICFEGDIELLHKYTNRPITLTGAQRKHISEIISIGVAHFERSDKVAGMVLKPGTSSYDLKRLKNELELFLVSVIESDQSRGETAASNAQNHVNESFSRLKRYLCENIDKSPSVSEMAEALSVSVSTLKAICRAGSDMSPTSYFIYLKMNRAKELIAKSTMNFTEISDSLGFLSVHYFSKLFKKKVGMTPTEYARINAMSKNK